MPSDHSIVCSLFGLQSQDFHVSWRPLIIKMYISTIIIYMHILFNSLMQYTHISEL